jgi:putative acetyltransferase
MSAPPVDGDGHFVEARPKRGDGCQTGRGVGRAMLDHILAEAASRGYTRLWLETGSTPDFDPARCPYERAGFVRCGPFADYVEDPFSVFMTLAL